MDAARAVGSATTLGEFFGPRNRTSIPDLRGCWPAVSRAASRRVAAGARSRRSPAPCSSTVGSAASRARSTPAARTRLSRPLRASFWRDILAFTWDIKTTEGREAIGAALAATAEAAAPRDWRLAAEPTPGVEGETECLLDFQTSAGAARAHVRLTPDGRARTLLTALYELHARPFAVGRHRPLGHPCANLAELSVPRPGRAYWHEARAAARAASALGGSAAEPYVLIVGAGQAGLSLGARLGLLGVPHAIVDAHARVGDSWRSRYPSLMLHDPVWYDHMPCLPFPPSWPVFTPRDKMADWLEMYAATMDIDVHVGTRVSRAAPPQSAGGAWTVELVRDGAPAATVRPAHVVLATGMSGAPRVPALDGDFNGEAVHSSAFRGASGGRYAGALAVVVGSNTSAHDICQDLWEHGAASVTMLQRSAGLVVSEESILRHGLGHLYSEEAVERGLAAEDADFLATTMPYRLLERRWRDVSERMRSTDAAMHASLAAAGYQLDFGFDATGVFGKSFRQGGGFYIDVGCAALIADGRVALRSGADATPTRLERRGVVLASGEVLPADLVVFATGYQPMQHFVRDLVSPDAAEAVGRVWGYGSGAKADPGPWEGELRAMWKPTGVDGLWLAGGNLAQSRHYSRFVALQLQARYLGLPTPVFRARAD